MNQVDQICKRNRECYFPLRKDVIVRFFLMPDGIVRDPRIIKSSGIHSHDMSCIDAVLCSSPLPLPPIRSSPLTPPISRSDGSLITLGNRKTIMVESLPSGPITIKFEANREAKYRFANWSSSNSLELPLIPIEVSIRYPKAFSKRELLGNRNFATFKNVVDVPRLEKFRYPWVEFIQSNKEPSRKSILKRLMVIQTYTAPERIEEDWKSRWK